MSNDHERHIASLTSALEDAKHTLRGKTDELSLVRRVGDAISHHASISSLSSQLVDAIAETINCKYALMYTGAVANGFELQALSSTSSGPEQFPVVIGDTGIVSHLEQSGSAIQIADIAVNPIWSEHWPFPKNLSSWLCVPLLTRNHLRGILCLANDTPGAFDEKTLRTLMMVVPQISRAFANIGFYNHLRLSEAKYRSLVTGIQDVVYICDRQWQIVDANPAAEALFGGSITGRTLTELFASRNTASQFVEAVRSSRTVQNFEAEMFTTNGRLVALLSCVGDDDHYSGVIKDMTERTRLMERITRAQKMESIGTLASGVAHDFNNILGIILPNAELIKMRTDPESACTRYADIIIKATRRAAELTKQLLSLSRKNPVAPRVVNLNDSVNATGQRLGQRLDRNIRLEYDLTSEWTKINADEAQVEQILLNLAINARNAMPEGGRLQFTTQCEGANVIVRVSDTGTGIEPEMLTKIFDPFFTTKDKSKGAGLGLSVVYAIVKRNGGSIDVKSEIGIGTEFILTFPSSNEGGTKSVRRTGKTTGCREKILVADDEPEMLQLLETTLTNLGYSVVCAQNGIEAVQHAEDDVQLIILDMMMPEMDGVAALRSIRQKLPYVKVLVSSGYTSPEKAPVLEALGIDAFVQKPFELAKLASTIRDVLDGVAV